MNVPRHKWTEAEDQIMAEAYPVCCTADLAAEFGLKISQVYDRAKKLNLKKSTEFMIAQKIAKGKRLASVSHKTRFKTGHATWNAGKHYQHAGGSVDSRYKAVHHGRSYLPIGSERIIKGGYLQRKMTHTGRTQKDWQFVHHLVWFSDGRTIPKGSSLVFRDGNPENIVLENLELKTKAEMMAANSCHNYGPEIAKAIQLRGVLRRKINKLTKDQSDDNSCK